MGGSRPAWLSSLTQHRSKPPMFLKIRSSEPFIICTITLAIFTDMFLYSSIVPVIPFALQSRVGIGLDNVQSWVSILIAVYGGALLAFCPICGWLADQSSSRRLPLLLGLLALLGATVMLNVGSSVSVLVVARVLQGASAAVVWVVGLALLADTVPYRSISQAMGWVGLGMSLGLLVGPLLGGVVFARAGYNAVFGMSYAIIGLDIILRLALIEKKVAVRWDPDVEDVTGHTGTASLRQGVHEEERDPGSSIDFEKASSPSASSPFRDSEKNIEKGTEKKASTASLQPPSPMTTTFLPPPPIASPKRPLRERLPPLFSLLYSRRLLAALWGAFVQSTLMTAFDSVLALQAAKIFHFNSTGAGLLFLPIVLPTFFAPLIGYLCDRYHPRYPATLGFLLACPPYVCLRYIDHNTLGDKVLFCALLACIGVSLALTFPPFMAEITLVVEAKERAQLAQGKPGFGTQGAYAQAYGLFNMAFAAGCLVGPVWAGFVREGPGWATMGWSLGLLSAVTAVPTFLWMGGWVGRKRAEEGGLGGEGAV
ncbi:MFS general substrate transporter [Mytilinidion resinicola]|uniref:MFS general substrate transporter n=1 Tax=Mytilinidion resinicola TaxID=574789 RepID=A0A6A6YY95_9PEZI|nr:MFS general substrate transporter [Mytilinidion resinicola]KAF2812895.1 MFS general substrate transporter [Mytilinidion resinicola]